MMKRTLTLIVLAVLALVNAAAQGWPDGYNGVMLQGFYWDSYPDSKWTNLTKQADELSRYFDLIWVPQSGWTNMETSMGYNPCYWYNQRSSFGTVQELKSMINAYKERGTGIIADVVINHRNGVTRWTDFPTETNPFDGKTYSMGLADICSTDEYNTAADAVSERATYGRATGANDTGDDFEGYRDLDHTSANVQENCMAYLKFLKDYLGYEGFRYDMVKGFGAQYVGLYNAAADPQFSVGECWDDKSTITNWIDGTTYNGAIQSAAFDFPLKYLMTNNPTKYSSWYNSTGALATDTKYCRYGVTFVDNHDTYRDENKYTGDVPTANAWILALPGTPCVFLPHWQEYKEEIKAMITVRKAAGITNTSEIKSVSSPASDCLVAEIQGAHHGGNPGSEYRLVVVIGDLVKAETYVSSKLSGLTKVLAGEKYAYYTDAPVESFTVSQPSGVYYGSVTVRITPVGSSTLVYTTDGTEPTAANGTQVVGGFTDVELYSSATLKVGILSNGEVKDVETYLYEVKAFEQYEATVYVNCPDWADNLYFYAWDDKQSLLGDWPGTKATQTVEKDGKTWYYTTFTITEPDYTFNFIFNHGSNAAQTVDITGLNSDHYFTLGTLSGGKYLVNDVTSEHTSGINSAVSDVQNTLRDAHVYSVDGRLLRSFKGTVSTAEAVKGLARGLYIVNNKKVLVR